MYTDEETGIARLSVEDLSWIIEKCSQKGGNTEKKKEAEQALEIKLRNLEN
jgi:hypothetical protein